MEVILKGQNSLVVATLTAVMQGFNIPAKRFNCNATWTRSFYLLSLSLFVGTFHILIASAIRILDCAVDLSP